MTECAETETLRRSLAHAIGVQESAIDSIKLRRANLAMRAVAAEEGLLPTGEDSLAWAHY